MNTKQKELKAIRQANNRTGLNKEPKTLVIISTKGKVLASYQPRRAEEVTKYDERKIEEPTPFTRNRDRKPMKKLRHKNLRQNGKSTYKS